MSDPTRIEENCIQNSLVSRIFSLDSAVMLSLRSHFSRNPLERYPAAQKLVWLPGDRAGGQDVTYPEDDQDVRTIRIETSDTFNPSQVGSLPAILTSCGQAASIRLGIANLQSFGNTRRDGSQIMTDAWAGSILVFCLSSIPRQSRLLGWESAEFIQTFSNQLRQHWQLSRLQVASMSQTAPLREAPTVLATKVTIEYGLVESWTISQDAPLLKRVEHTHTR